MLAAALFALSLTIVHALRPPEVPIVHPSGTLQRRAVPGSQTGVIQYLSNGNSDTYIIHLEVGNPPNSYPFQLDTASADLLIASSLCTSSSCPDVKSTSDTPLYTPGRSTSFDSVNANGTTFNLTYADGSQASGFLALERIGIRGAAGKAVVAEDQVMGVVNSTTMDLEALGVSGIVGLGFPRLSVLVRDALGGGDEGTPSTSERASATSTRSEPTATSSSSAPLDSTSAFFSILPIETITPLPTTTSTSSSLTRRADIPAYFPPLLETLFAHPSINSSSPRLSYPVFSLALANNSNAYSAANANASITWGGISSAYVRSATDSSNLPTVSDIDWVSVVPFAHANQADNSAGNATAVLESEAYLYWAVPLVNVSLNGMPISVEPTYNSSTTGVEGSIALLDVGTNGIYAPQQDAIRLFAQIKDARQVSEGTWAVPCDTETTISFTIGATEIVLQPSEWIDARVEGSGMCLAWPRVAPSAGDGVDWQLGTPVLRKVVVVFSYGISGEQAPLIGLLDLPSATQGTASTTVSSIANATTTSVQKASEILQHVTKTVGTALPNVILPDPSYKTPAYLFTTPPIPAGSLQTAGLANPLVYSVEDLPIVSAPSTSTLSSSGTMSGSAPSGARTSEASTGNGNTTSGACSRVARVGLVVIVFFGATTGFLVEHIIL
ncbi:hypothetical protein NliqN6_6050 [Naganishia liquefaciens]|uniref:Peptidase A1 domain-containing protein n=1 Tax=Naganishia liquefaciens TaxID=104408 RepID=A0A8H3YHS5_9TREE|nr:hypothetical protein NliqN6_6050 [Naganishia liquefaciens]